MPQRTLPRVLLVTALLCALTLVLPPRAEAAPLSGGSFWGWLAELVESRIPSLLGGHAFQARKAPTNAKAGAGSDPNGGNNPPAAGASTNGSGGGEDPHG
jgi:hypothetical protein